MKGIMRRLRCLRTLEKGHPEGGLLSMCSTTMSSNPPPPLQCANHCLLHLYAGLSRGSWGLASPHLLSGSEAARPKNVMAALHTALPFPLMCCTSLNWCTTLLVCARVHNSIQGGRVSCGDYFAAGNFAEVTEKSVGNFADHFPFPL